MATYTVRPNGFVSKDNTIQGTTDSGSTWVTPTNAQIATYLGDNSDTTAVRSSGDSARTILLDLVNPTIASDEFIVRVGQFLRWSGGVSGKYVGCIAYKATETVPLYLNNISTTSTQTTPLTSDLGYRAGATTWVNYDAADLRLKIMMDGHGTASYRPVIWDAGAYLYTMKRATAVPQTLTYTTGTYATVPVDVTATIDWEASTYAWQNLRTITVELRVESGGSSIGTGTLVTSTTVDVVFDATGTNTIDVTLPVSLPNGTYKTYARAIRHRENELEVAADQIGAWSSAATLTMTVTPPNAPTITASADNSQGRVELTITPVASSGYINPYFTVERSEDAGVTWTPVRGLTVVSCSFGIPSLRYDYEAPRGQAVRYRARVSAYTSGVLNTSNPSGSASATLTATTWNLKCPQAPNLNMIGVTVINNPSENLNEDVGIFRPDNRRYPVVVSGSLTGWDGDLNIITLNGNEWEQVKALLEAKAVLYLESPFGWSKYIRLSGERRTTLRGTATTPRRDISVQYVETASPTGGYITTVNQFGLTLDFGNATTSTWDDTIDCGLATRTVTASVDGGAAA